MRLMTTDTLYFNFFIYFSISFWRRGAIFWAARTSLLLKENHYSIGTFKEESFVRSGVSDSLHFGNDYIFSLLTANKFRNMQCQWDIDFFLVSEANNDVARRICVVQGQDGFSSKIEIISHDVKVLKSEHWKILSVHSLYLVFINCL